MSKLSPRIALVLLALMLTGCVTSQDYLPSPNLNVEVTRQCERLKPAHKFPAINEDTDYRNLSGETLVLLKQAYRQGDRYSACILRVIDQYAGKPK